MAYLRYQSQTFRNASDRVRRLFFASNTRNDHNSAWVSGKYNDNMGEIHKRLNQQPEVQKQSLTDDIGVLVFEESHYVLPKVDATQYDLSSFGVKLVRNDQPFKITRNKEDPLDALTYHFGTKYAEMARV